jgi:hypothetical protein
VYFAGEREREREGEICLDSTVKDEKIREGVGKNNFLGRF